MPPLVLTVDETTAAMLVGTSELKYLFAKEVSVLGAAVEATTTAQQSASWILYLCAAFKVAAVHILVLVATLRQLHFNHLDGSPPFHGSFGRFLRYAGDDHWVGSPVDSPFVEQVRHGIFRKE